MGIEDIRKAAGRILRNPGGNGPGVKRPEIPGRRNIDTSDKDRLKGDLSEKIKTLKVQELYRIINEKKNIEAELKAIKDLINKSVKNRQPTSGAVSARRDSITKKLVNVNSELAGVVELLKDKGFISQVAKPGYEEIEIPGIGSFYVDSETYGNVDTGVHVEDVDVSFDKNISDVTAILAMKRDLDKIKDNDKFRNKVVFLRDEIAQKIDSLNKAGVLSKEIVPGLYDEKFLDEDFYINTDLLLKAMYKTRENLDPTLEAVVSPYIDEDLIKSFIADTKTPFVDSGKSDEIFIETLLHKLLNKFEGTPEGDNIKLSLNNYGYLSSLKQETVDTVEQILTALKNANDEKILEIQMIIPDLEDELEKAKKGVISGDIGKEIVRVKKTKIAKAKAQISELNKKNNELNVYLERLNKIHTSGVVREEAHEATVDKLVPSIKTRRIFPEVTAPEGEALTGDDYTLMLMTTAKQSGKDLEQTYNHLIDLSKEAYFFNKEYSELFTNPLFVAEYTKSPPMIFEDRPDIREQDPSRKRPQVPTRDVWTPDKQKATTNFWRSETEKNWEQEQRESGKSDAEIKALKESDPAEYQKMIDEKFRTRVMTPSPRVDSSVIEGVYRDTAYELVEYNTIELPTIKVSGDGLEKSMIEMPINGTWWVAVPNDASGKMSDIMKTVSELRRHYFRTASALIALKKVKKERDEEILKIRKRYESGSSDDGMLAKARALIIESIKLSRKEHNQIKILGLISKTLNA